MTHDVQLVASRRNITSQFGEDGVLERLFEIIGAENRSCVEFGAGDGKQNSNTWNLINNHGWSAVLMEADRSEYERLHSLYLHNDRVVTMQEVVERDGASGLGTLLGRTQLPKDFDFLSIDIDGDDYHVWQSLEGYWPRVVLVEYNHTIPYEVAFVQAYHARVRGGASLSMLKRLGTEKGYRLVYAHGTNALFVEEALAQAFDLPEFPEAELHAATPPAHPYFQLYDGSVVLWGSAASVERRARERKFLISQVWIGGGNVLSPIFFAREWPLARRIKEYVKRLAVYPFARAFYDVWMRKLLRRLRHKILGRSL